MSSPYAGADSFPGTVAVLDDGDPPDAATWAPALEGLADRTIFLRNRLLGTEAGDEVPISMIAGPGSTVNFTWDSPDMQWRQDSVASAGVLWFDMSTVLPKSGVLTQLELFFAGAPGHAAFPGGAPATMPKLSLWRKHAQTAGAATSLGTATDASATEAIYEGVHGLSITGLTEAISHSSDNRYYLTFEGETGANSIVGLILLGMYCLVDPS
jgi:hypothetical protein